MSFKLNEQGSPVSPSMVIERDPSKVAEAGRVKDHKVYKYEYKPWGYDPYPGAGAGHPSSEIHYIYRTVLRLGVGNYANLGTFRGVTASAMAHALKELGGGTIYTIDLHDLTRSKDRNGAFSVPKLIKIFKQRGTYPYVDFCKGYTHEWAETLKHLLFKFVFIDADHHYETCKQDFLLWSALLEPEGEIAFHDVDMNTVDRVITEELTDWELIEHIGRIKTFKRKGVI